MLMSKENQVAWFRDYMNNFLTVDRFAAHYNISVTTAKRVIDGGRKLHDENAANIKQGQNDLYPTK